jgi:hypothetical protein
MVEIPQVCSVKSTLISLDYLTKHAHYTGSANAMHDRPRKRQRTETHSAASSDGSEPGISMESRVDLQSLPKSMSESETDPCGMNRQKLQASGMEILTVL